MSDIPVSHVGLGAVAVLLLYPIAGGCGGERGLPETVTVRDSAGIRILESSAPAWTRGSGWRLSETPPVRIGTPEGTEAEQLFRVNDAARFDDGRIAVANGGSHEIRIYSATGEHIRSIGRRGGGPGEFRFPRRVWILPGDSILVMDRVRLSTFDQTGTFVASIPVPRPVPILRGPDGTFLSTAFAPGTRAREMTYQRPDIVAIRVRPDGSRQDTLVQLSGDERFHVTWTDGVLAYPAPFGARRSFALNADSLFTGEGSVFEIQLLDPNGVTRRIMRRPDLPRAIGPADIERYEAGMLETLPAEALRQRTRDLFDTWDYPEVHPAWDMLVRDATGALWVRHYVLDENEPTTWSIFAPAGQWLGEMVLPARLRVLEIGADHVLGVSTDGLGVEYVDLYELDRRPAG